MNGITAIILAAGMGVRMGPRGKLQPKGLLKIGGVPLVRHSVACLQARSVARIVIVTGHLCDQYQAEFAGQDVTLIHNPDYATTGSLRTLAVALDHVEGPCAILESDLIYAPQALDPISLMSSRLVTSGPTGAGDEVYVWANESGHLQQLSKQKTMLPQPHYGELVGVTGLSAQAVALLPEVADRVLHGKPEEHYEYGLVALARTSAIEVVRLDDLPWAEVDDAEMLDRATRVVYPRILAARQLAKAG